MEFTRERLHILLNKSFIKEIVEETPRKNKNIKHNIFHATCNTEMCMEWALYV